MSILFKNAGILANENGKFKFIKNGYLGVTGDTIDYIGTEKPRVEYSEEKDMYDKILMPGLINCHGHSAMNLLRGVGNDLPLLDWLHIIWPIEDRMREVDFVNGMNMAILEMLACGTTSFCDMYWMPYYTHKCIGQSGIKANLTRVMMGAKDTDDYLNFPKRLEALEFKKEWDGAYDGRLHVDWCVHGQYTIEPAFAQKWADELNTLGGRLHIHLSETKNEHEESKSKYGMTPAQWFEKLGFFNLPTYAAHCVWCEDKDLEILKKHNVSVVHNPESNMKLGSGFAPVQKMLDKGINVTIGTDGAASNNNLNMFEEMHLAGVIHNGYHNDPVIMNPEAVLRMATINGAKLQGREDTGSLEVGKKADITAVNTDAPHMVPNYNTPALLVYSAQGSDVTMTMVDGKILYENGIYKTMDREKIFAEYKKSVEYIGC